MSGGSTEQVFAGKYRLIAELGRGGMAEVHLSVASGPGGFNKLVVIKQLRQNLADDPEFLVMFMDEARLAARLNHPNVVHTYEVVADGDQHFIAMEYLDGQPLHRIIRQLGRGEGLPLPMHLRILADVLGGLHYAHELADYDGTLLNVVHRDATPQNIFVTYEGQTKVVDFGIAKALNSSSETRSGVIKGKIAYMSPEQSRSEPVDRRTDVFAVGVMLWEAATGQRLWKGLADVTILQRLMMNIPVPSPKSIKPDLSDGIEAICMKALAPLREDRHATALDLQNDIENLLMDMKVRVTGREVGKFIGEKFASERAEIRTIIEAQLKTKPDDGSRVAKLPTLAHTNSNPSMTLERSVASGRLPSASLPPEGELLTPMSAVPTSSAQTLLTTTPTVVSLNERKGARNPLQMGLIAGGVVAAGFVGWMMLKGGADSSAAKAAVPAPAPSAAVDTSKSRLALNLKAAPSEAQFFLDDERLAGNPYAGIKPKDGSTHQLRVEAPGFVTKSKTLVLDSDISLDIELERAALPDDGKKKDGKDGKDGKGSSKGSGGRVEPAKTAGGKTGDPPKTDGAPATTTTTTPQKGSNVRLDTDNPWK